MGVTSTHGPGGWPADLGPTTDLEIALLPSSRPQNCSSGAVLPTQGPTGSPPKGQMGATPIYTLGNRPTICKPNCGPWSRVLSQCQLYWSRSWRQFHFPRDQTGSMPTWAPGKRPSNHRCCCRPSSNHMTWSQPHSTVIPEAIPSGCRPDKRFLPAKTCL